MPNSNNEINLVLRASNLQLHKDRYIIGKVYHNASDLYNDHRDSNHPYELKYFRPASEDLSVVSDSDSSPNSKYIVGFFDGDLHEGIDFTDRDRTVSSRGAFVSDNLNSVDINNLSDDDDDGYGTFLIGPQGPYHNFIINESKQNAYWISSNPSGLFNTSYIDFESTGIENITRYGYTDDVARIYDIKRDSYHYPVSISVLNPGINHGLVSKEEGDNNYSVQYTRNLSSSGISVSVTGGSFLSNLAVFPLQNSYDLGSIRHTSDNDDFSLYLKFRPTGYPDTINETLGTNSIQLFKNHTLKVSLVPVEEPDPFGDHDGKFKIAIFGRTGNDTTNSFSAPDNANSIVGFEPDPGGKNAIRENVSQNTSNNIYYEWLGSDTSLMTSLGSSWDFPYKFGVNKIGFLDGVDESNFQGLHVVGRNETASSYGSVASYNYSTPKTLGANDWPQDMDQEVEFWYNWGILLPEPIEVNRTTSFAMSYAASGSDERNNLLFRNFRDPYTTGVVMNEPSTLSIMYNHHVDDSNSQFRKTMNLARESFYNEGSYSEIEQKFHSVNTNNHKTRYASYDLNFMYNVNIDTGDNIKPFQTFSEITGNRAFGENVFNGFTATDHYGSGYLGCSNFIGIIEEFGYGTDKLSPIQRKSLLDNSANLGGLIAYNTDGAFTSDSPKVSLVANSGTSFGDNAIGGAFNSDYSISSSLEIPITNYLSMSADTSDDLFIWDMYPFPDPNDLVLNVVLSHDAGPGLPSGVFPPMNSYQGREAEVYCDIIDKSQSDFTSDPGANFSADNLNIFKNKIDQHNTLNQKGTWRSNRITLDPEESIQKVTFSGVFDGGCGNWDLKDKIVKFTVEYESYDHPYDVQLDIYAMDLDVEWFKTSVDITGEDSSSEVDLYVRGVQPTTISDDTDLFLQSDRADSFFDMYMGVDNGVGSGNIDLFMSSSESGVGGVYNNNPLYIRGLDTIPSSVDLFTRFEYPAETLPLFMGNITPDSITTIKNTTLFMNGQFVSPSGREANLFIFGTSQYGNVDPQSVLPLFLDSPDSDSSIDPTQNMPLFIDGVKFNQNNSVNLSLLNAWSGSVGDVDLVIRKDGRLDGGVIGTGDMPLYIERVPKNSEMVQLCLVGHESPISSGVDLFISSKLPSTTGTIDMMVKNNRSTENLNIYMRGFK